MMSEAYAIDKTAKGYNFAYQSNKLEAITPTTLMTNKYKQFTSLNEVKQLEYCVFTYKSILYAFNDIDWGKTISGIDDAYIKDYEKKINPESIKNIKVSKLKDYTSYDPNIEDLAEVYSADESELYGVELDCDGKSVYSDIINVLRYGNSWYINGIIIFDKGNLSQ